MDVSYCVGFYKTNTVMTVIKRKLFIIYQVNKRYFKSRVPQTAIIETVGKW